MVKPCTSLLLYLSSEAHIIYLSGVLYFKCIFNRRNKHSIRDDITPVTLLCQVSRQLIFQDDTHTDYTYNITASILHFFNKQITLYHRRGVKGSKGLNRNSTIYNCRLLCIKITKRVPVSNSIYDMIRLSHRRIILW